MKRILVPYDFSDFSKEALKFAVNFANQYKSEIILLHAIHIPAIFVPTLPAAGPLGYDFTLFKSMEDDANKEFEKILEEIKVPQPRLSYKVIYGEVDDTIVYESDIQDADVVIMGTAGTDRPHGPFIGTTTEKVVRNSKVPVIIVRKSVALQSIRNILLPSQLPLKQHEVMHAVKDMQCRLDARLHILLVNTPGNFMTDRMAKESFAEFVNQYQLTNYEFHFCSYTTQEAGIVDFALNRNIDMILMPTHGRKGISHIVYGSITEDVLSRIECPIMTINMAR